MIDLGCRLTFFNNRFQEAKVAVEPIIYIIAIFFPHAGVV